MCKKYLLFIVLMLSFLSCKNTVNDDENIKIIEHEEIPLATDEELTYYTEICDKIVDYKLMQKIALIELIENYAFFGFDKNDALSETPVIIFNANTNLPEYYEFEVFRGDILVGYITTVANKTKGEPIQFVSIEPKIFIDESTRSVKSGVCKIYDNNYPCIIYKNDCRKIDEKNDIDLKTKFVEYLNGYSDEELQNYGVTREQLLQDYENSIITENERLNCLWKVIEEERENILSQNIEDTKKSRKSFDDKSWRVQLLNSWVDRKYDFKKAKTGYCGPTALGIVLAGYYGSSDCSYYVNRLIDVGLKSDGPVYHADMNSALKDASSNKLKLRFCMNHIYNEIWNEVSSNNLPVLSLRMGNSSAADWHYRVIIGMAQKNTSKVKTAKWYNYSTDKYYYMADNGSDFSLNANKPYSNKDGYNYDAGGNKFWEKHRENGWYFQHFPVEKK